MDKKFLPGDWAIVDHDLKLDLYINGVERERHEGEKLFAFIMGETKPAMGTSYFYFLEDGTCVGLEYDHTPEHYLTKCEPPAFAEFIKFTPVAAIEVFPGFVDQRTGLITDCFKEDEVNKDKYKQSMETGNCFIHLELSQGSRGNNRDHNEYYQALTIAFGKFKRRKEKQA